MSYPRDYAKMKLMPIPAFIITVLAVLTGGMTAVPVHAQETTRVLWREDPLQQLKVNSDFISASPEHIRAILAFLSTRAGTACQQTEPTVVTVDLNDPELLNMKLADMFTPAKLTCELSAGIGFDDQCSDEHIAFVKKWFRRDAAVFQEVEKCARVPATAALQRVFSAIEMKEDGNAVEVRYAITQTDNRTGARSTQRFVDRYELEYDMLRRTVHDTY